jgi:DNA-binding XRE family transcriptional regulator
MPRKKKESIVVVEKRKTASEMLEIAKSQKKPARYANTNSKEQIEFKEKVAKHEMTRSQIAKALDISIDTMHHWLYVDFNPNQKNLEKINNFFK